MFSFVAEKIHSSPEKKGAPRPCHESAGQGKLLLALVGPESHDFNLVMGVTSGKGHLMPWRTVAHFQQQREDPLTPSPILPCPSPSHHTSLSGCSRCCSEYNHRCAFVQNHKTLKVLQKVLFDKTVIIIIILYNIVPFRIHSKNLHVPQLLKFK